MEAFAVAFGIVFLAELGDKSQLMALTLATRYPALAVLSTIGVATALVMAVSVLAGAALAAFVPPRALAVAAGLAFLGFAVWTLRSRDGKEERAAGGRGAAALAAAGVTFFLSEVGDKTMLATATLATREQAAWTWAGATAGMVTADGIAILLGRALGKRVPESWTRLGAAIAFVACGMVLLVQALQG